MSANLLCINGTIVCKSKKEAPKSFEILEQQMGPKYKIVGLDMSEIEKAVGSLTCMSLRFNKPTSVRPATQKQLVCRYEEM
jgi:N-dimethylarginine dimethylaminohydrolase